MALLPSIYFSKVWHDGREGHGRPRATLTAGILAIFWTLPSRTSREGEEQEV
jgi:hypothetical protein